MKTFTITLTETQRNNLIAFLKRSTLTGEEVPTFTDVAMLVQTAKEMLQEQEE